MKILLLVIGLLTCGACKRDPTVPRDNSHYVEGKSRYIWMSDGEGDLVLVDLHEPVNEALLSSRSGVSNQYWLYTRNNPTSAQYLIHGNDTTIWSSHFAPARPLMVIVHGWYSSGHSPLNPLIASAFLDVRDGNVIVVDWSDLAGSNYLSAAMGVADVGRSLGDFLMWLFDTAGGDWDKVHLVGFSLGAHVVGFAGRTAGGRPGRVTGLDPAGPGWKTNKHSLSTDAGQYVEAIHTDSGILGVFHAVGHADMYPNGGVNPQPGCWLSTCSHTRSIELFASSVRNSDRFIGSQCRNMLLLFVGICSGDTLAMGNAIETKRGSGLFQLRTGNQWPYLPT